MTPKVESLPSARAARVQGLRLKPRLQGKLLGATASGGVWPRVAGVRVSTKDNTPRAKTAHYYPCMWLSSIGSHHTELRMDW